MIIRGDLGYGAERQEILKNNGLDVEHINSLVNQRLKELGY